jgi:hypothetical protein
LIGETEKEMIRLEQLQWNEISKTLDSLAKFLQRVDIEPEELQRGVVCDVEWQSNIFTSIILGIKIPDVYLSAQKEDYNIMGRDGVYKLVRYKNIDGLQRITSCLNILDGKVRLPVGFEVGGIDFSNMNYHDILKDYPEIASDINDTPIKFVIYNDLTAEQESHQFRIVLNNSNKMTPAQWRNPIVSEPARHCRKTARELIASKPHKLFEISVINGKTEAKYFGQKEMKAPKKMEFDEEYARIIFWILNGISVSCSNKNLDNMYLDKNLEKRLSAHSTLYNRNTDLGVEGIRVLDKLYDIFGDGKSKQDVGKITLRSAVLFIFELQAWELVNKRKVKNISKLFWELHDELMTLSPVDKKAGLKNTVYSDNLSRITTATNVEDNSKKWKQLIVREA